MSAVNRYCTILDPDPLDQRYGLGGWLALVLRRQSLREVLVFPERRRPVARLGDEREYAPQQVLIVRRQLGSATRPADCVFRRPRLAPIDRVRPRGRRRPGAEALALAIEPTIELGRA